MNRRTSLFLLALFVPLAVADVSVDSGAVSPIAPPSPSPSTSTENSSPPLAYERLRALDFPKLKAALEQAGWPAPHVQAFLNVEIQHRLNPPPERTAADFRPFVYWRTGPDAEPLAHLNTRSHIAEEAKREEAARAQFEALFSNTEQMGDQLLLEWDERRKWGSVPEEKRPAISSLLSKAEQQRDALMHSRGGMLTLEEHRQLWQLAERTRSDLAGMLSAGELLDYDLRNSATANRMRAELDNFRPTEPEFLAIFKLRLPLELEFAHKAVGQDPEVDRQRAVAEASADKAIAKLLGPERYDDYQISLQPACQVLQFDGRFAGASVSTVRTLYRALRATQTRIKEAEALPPAEKSARVAELKKRLHDQFRQVLDEEGTRRFLQEQELWP